MLNWFRRKSTPLALALSLSVLAQEACVSSEKVVASISEEAHMTKKPQEIKLIDKIIKECDIVCIGLTGIIERKLLRAQAEKDIGDQAGYKKILTELIDYLQERQKYLEKRISVLRKSQLDAQHDGLKKTAAALDECAKEQEKVAKAVAKLLVVLQKEIKSDS